MQTNKVFLRQLSTEHNGNRQAYQLFKQTIDASPLLYEHDFHFYNDNISTRHERNIKEVKYLQQLIKQGKLQTGMLHANTFNTFYPSYVLHHHYSVFLPMLHTLTQTKELIALVKAAKNNQITGAFFHQTKSTDLLNKKVSIPVIDDQGIIKMDQNAYFYSLVTSPYITHAAFLTQHKEKTVLAVIAVRNKEGHFNQGVKVFDFGATISSDYLPVGYNFNSLKPSLTIELSPPVLKKLQPTHLHQRIAQFSYSLKDFQKSLWVTIKYTSMRRQFRTIQGTKQERKIITYRAVVTRIIDAFAQFQALSDLYARNVVNSKRTQLAELLQSSHHVILEHLILLRQCCGGFGYMQYSGHPGCIERVCNRTGNESGQHLKLSQNYLKETQFFNSTDQLQKFYTLQVKSTPITYMQTLSIFLSICNNMQTKKEQLTSQHFRREFLKQTSIINMHGREEFIRHQANNIHCQLLQYLLLSYILKNPQYIQWSLIHLSKQTLFQYLQTHRIQFFQAILSHIDELCSTLELHFLRNTIVGRQHSEQFYEELLTTSKGNLRNSQEYQEYVRAPIIEMITENRAKI